jgi:hypothetical protein
LLLPEDNKYRDKVNAEDEEHKGQLLVVFDSKTIETMREITSELITARSLPIDPDSVSVSDPVAILVNNLKKDWGSEDPEERARELMNVVRNYYKQQHQAVSQDAMIIALTYHNEFDFDPLPYEDEGEEDDDLPAWVSSKKRFRIPPPAKNLQNIYEGRVKQIYDLLDEDIEFQLLFQRKTEAAFVKALRVAEDSDDDGFRVQSAS